MNVIKNAKRNLIFGFANKAVTILCPFLTRTFIYITFGAEYLGMNSLFKSILQVLNLTELGFGVAIVCSLYKPVAENDIVLVDALLYFYRRVYHAVGVMILIIGIALIPLLPYLISGDYPADMNLVRLYLISLADTVISYFMFAYLSSLIIVYQRDDVNSITNMIMTVGMTVVQIIMLIEYHSYFMYALMMPLFTVAKNLRIAIVVHRMYPQYHCEGKLPTEVLKDIRKKVQGSLIAKVCTVARNSMDSICISAFIGLEMTAKYNNYYYILAAAISLLEIVSSAFIGGVGNHVVTRSKDQNFEELKELDLVYMMVSGWCCALILCLSQPFMELWMGENMLLPMPMVIIMCIYFYLLRTGDMRSIYTEVAGLWWEHRWRSFSEALANMVLNILLVKYLGIYGVIIATIVTIFLINFIWGASITFKNIFGIEKIWKYYGSHLKYAFTTLGICGAAYMFCRRIFSQNLYVELLCRGIVCSFVTCIGYLCIYWQNPLFKNILKRLNRKR